MSSFEEWWEKLWSWTKTPQDYQEWYQKAEFEDCWDAAYAAAIESTKFQKPRRSEVTEYCRSRNVDSEAWYAHYESVGWVVGAKGKQKPMKNWKAAVRTWERKNAKNRGVSKPSLAEQATRARIEYERASASQVSPGIYQVDVKLVGEDDALIRVQLDND